MGERTKGMGNKENKLCPMQDWSGVYVFCQEESCAWWNDKYNCCSLRSLTPTISENKDIKEAIRSEVMELLYKAESKPEY